MCGCRLFGDAPKPGGFQKRAGFFIAQIVDEPDQAKESSINCSVRRSSSNFEDPYTPSGASRSTAVLSKNYKPKFKNSQNNIKIKKKNGIKVKNGDKVKFKLGHQNNYPFS